MKKNVMPVLQNASQNSSCFMPIQSFDLGAQDPLLELFADSTMEAVMKHEASSGMLHARQRLHHHHHAAAVAAAAASSNAHSHHSVSPDSMRSDASTGSPNPLVYLTAALPVPPQLDPPMKRRKRRAPSTPKHVEDLARLQEMSSSENSDSERGGNVKLQIRKLKNRASAAKSRIKAQARQEQLEKNVVELHRQNAYLRDLVIAMAKSSGQPLPAMPQASEGGTFDIAL